MGGEIGSTEEEALREENGGEARKKKGELKREMEVEEQMDMVMVVMVVMGWSGAGLTLKPSPWSLQSQGESWSSMPSSLMSSESLQALPGRTLRPAPGALLSSHMLHFLGEGEEEAQGGQTFRFP